MNPAASTLPAPAPAPSPSPSFIAARCIILIAILQRPQPCGWRCDDCTPGRWLGAGNGSLAGVGALHFNWNNNNCLQQPLPSSSKPPAPLPLCNALFCGLAILALLAPPSPGWNGSIGCWMSVTTTPPTLGLRPLVGASNLLWLGKPLGLTPVDRVEFNCF